MYVQKRRRYTNGGRAKFTLIIISQCAIKNEIEYKRNLLTHWSESGNKMSKMSRYF